MTASLEETQWCHDTFERMRAKVGQAVLGKPDAIKLVLTCLLSEGRPLIEDYPGTVKTSLAKTVNTVQARHGRIQLTPELLRTDATG